MKTQPRIISLCPGTGIGEFGSKVHFRTVLAVDIEKKFLKSFEANHPGVPTLCADIGKPETIAAAKKIAPEVEGIIASTPCVDVAQCKSMELEDRYSSEMTMLYVRAIDWVQVYMPMFYICEIVKGIEDLWYFHTATARLEQMGYRWTRVTLDAADFGVPQHRVRTFLLAVRKGIEIPSCLVQTHGDDKQRKTNPQLKKYLTLKDAIYDLYLRELAAIKKGEQAHEKFLQEDMLGVAKLSAKRAFYLSFVPPGGNWKHLPFEIKKALLEDLRKKGKSPFDGMAAKFAWLTTPGALRTSPSVQLWSMPIHPGFTKYARPSWSECSSKLLAEPANRKLLISVGVHGDDAKALQKAGFWMRRPGWSQLSGAVCSTPDGDKRAHINPGYLVNWVTSNEGAQSSQQTARCETPIITRYLNVREYCRIMGLPDSFVPLGSTADKYRMIGNGICPAVMEAVCGAAAKVLPNPPKGSSIPKRRTANTKT